MSESRITELLENSMGNKGSKEITGVLEVTADNIFSCIQFIEDSTVAAQTDIGTVNADLTAFTLIVAGTIIYGRWSTITLSSGSAIGYNG